MAWPASSSDFRVREAELLLLLAVGRDVARRDAPAVRENHLDFLAAKRSLQHRLFPGAVGRLEHIELVGIDGALHHILAKTERAGDEHDILEAGLRVDREDDAGRGEVRANHLHDADGIEDLEMVEAIVDAIADRAIGEQARETVTHRVEHVGFAAHIEIAVVLAGETGARQILRRRRRADGDAQLRAIFRRQSRQRRADLRVEIGGQGGGVDDLARPRGAARQIVDIGNIESDERLFQRRPSAGGLERMAIGLGGDREAIGNGDALRREFPEHLAKRGVLAADQRNVLDADLAKEADDSARRPGARLPLFDRTIYRPRRISCFVALFGGALAALQAEKISDNFVDLKIGELRIGHFLRAVRDCRAACSRAFATTPRTRRHA